MKIIHCADIHLDAKMETNFDKDKAAERKRELLLTFERLVRLAQEEKVDVILICGDMFDSDKVLSKTKARIFNIIKENSNIDFIYLSGNHDEENIIKSQSENLSNLKVFKDNWTTFDYGEIAISGRIFSGSKSLYDTLNLDGSKFNIVALHGPITKYNLKNEREEVSLAKLKDKGIDYLALGHIHNFEIGQLDKRGVYCYSGCLEGRGFDECGEKGFVLLEIKNKKLEYKFIPFASRVFCEIEVDITGKEDWFEIENEVLKRIKDIDKKNIVKVLLTGKYLLSLNKQVDLLERKLKGEFFFAKVKDKSTLEVNAKDFEYDLSLKGEFIRQVLASDLSQQEKEQILIVGINALCGEALK